MNGILGIEEHYELEENGLPAALKVPDDILDVDKTRIVCPDCRGPLRDIPRYGRVVRRALLIQDTLKFITWSNMKYISLAKRFFQAQAVLQVSIDEAKPADISLSLAGSRGFQIDNVATGFSRQRYRDIITLRNEIGGFKNSVHKPEQPFQRVQHLVRYARKSEFTFDLSVIFQTRSFALATALLIRCDLAIFSDVLSVHSSKKSSTEVITAVDLEQNCKDCDDLFLIADEGKRRLQQAEAYIFWAHHAALEILWHSAQADNEENEALKTLQSTATSKLQLARPFCANHVEASPVADEIDIIDKMLRESAFYSPVTSAEVRKVVAAMAQEFSGTGHWYRCRNGHPFTVGGCGGPMQETTCPQCGEPVGGRSHRAAAGVTRADDMERDFGNMSL